MGALAFHRKLLLSTVPLVGALAGYARGAYAACPPAGGVCTGTNLTTQTVNAPNATVTTDNTFSVDTTVAGGKALVITGAGAISYTDANASPLTAPNAGDTALDIRSTGDIGGGNQGSVTVNTDGTLIGGDYGIYARNDGSLALEITANGNVEGTNDTGIFARNVNGTDLTVTTGAGTTVKGSKTGIFARNYGSLALTIKAYGNVEGTNNLGIYAHNDGTGTDLSVTTGAGTTVTGGDYGIRARNYGSLALTIKAYGNVTGTNISGIYAKNYGTDVSVTTGAGTVTSGFIGVFARNSGNGVLSIAANGDVTGTANDGIYARHDTGGPINITIGSASTVTSNAGGADDFAVDVEDGPGSVTVAGALNGAPGGGAVQFDPGNALDDRLELHPTATVNGNVLAGPGTDTLAFAGTGDGTFDLANIDTGANTQQYRDFEIFQVESATWNLTGATTEAFTVTGGRVEGIGTFGGLTVNGGTLAPGNSIGTMTVNGAFTLAAGAIYQVEVNAAGQNDKVIVKGTVNLTGATLKVLAANGNYQPKTKYTIIDNDGTDAVAGTFGAITSSLAFLVPTVFYNGGTGNDVVLTLERNATLFSNIAKTPNQRAVAGALDRFPTGNALYLAVLNQTASGARAAFDALSGEIHATAAGVLADDSRYVREAVLGRLMQAGHGSNSLAVAGPQMASLDAQAYALGSPLAGGGESLGAPPSSTLAFWTGAFGAWGDFDSDGNAASASRDLGGFVSGMDAGIGGSWRVGLATGASFSNIDVNARHSSADVDSYYLGGYFGGMAGAFALRGGGMWAWSDIDTSRAVVFPGFSERQKASYDADTGQIFGEIAYPTQMGDVALEPFGGLAFVSVDTDTFVERGGALASLRGRDTDQDVGYSTLGVRAATTMYWGEMLVVPHLSAAWQHAFDDVTPGAALAFASTGIGFTATGVPLAQDSALIDAGLDFALGANATAGVSYSGQFGGGVTDNAVKGRVTLLF